MGGATALYNRFRPAFASFNRRGDSLGGATSKRHITRFLWLVSIAEAILWGEQHSNVGATQRFIDSFNRRGDSLGGATSGTGRIVHQDSSFNRRGDSLGGATRLSLLRPI